MHLSSVVVVACILFTGGFAGWHLKVWQDKRAEEKAKRQG
jgi:hypothetical protein